MSTQEEADIRVSLHAAYAAEAGYMAVVITSEDTDVHVLSLAPKGFIPFPMFVKCRQQNRTKYTDVSIVGRILGSDLCKSPRLYWL